MTHWPPKYGDAFYDESREDYKKNPFGKIIRVARDFETDSGEVLVRFKGQVIEWDSPEMVEAPFPMNGQVVCRLRNVRIDGQLHHHSIVRENPTMLYEGGDVQTYSFEELENNWESSEGGEGCWKLEE